MKRTSLTRHTPMKRSPMRTKRKASHVTKDGRVILGQRDYAALRALVYNEQDGRCGKCGEPTWLALFELHHKKRRGMGGSTRNDSRDNVVGLCHNCHVEETPQPEWSAHDTR